MVHKEQLERVGRAAVLGSFCFGRFAHFQTRLFWSCTRCQCAKHPQQACPRVAVPAGSAGAKGSCLSASLTSTGTQGSSSPKLQRRCNQPW